MLYTTLWCEGSSPGAGVEHQCYCSCVEKPVRGHKKERQSQAGVMMFWRTTHLAVYLLAIGLSGKSVWVSFP